MKGVVFDLLERTIVAEHGEDAWDDLLATTGLTGAYTSLGSYPDGQFRRLVDEAAVSFGMSPQDVIRWFGRKALPMLAASYPEFFTPHTSTRPFLLTLNDIIHPEVRKVYPGADVPWFDISATADGALVMGYQSQRRLCSFAEGLITGAADYFAEDVAIDQPRCMLRGDSACALVVRLG
ncbi:MAG: heme NO-binding protein [Chloroflexi bacterium]|nr:MAG: heme NO-binding protein [Chloroflexota bacterium]